MKKLNTLAYDFGASSGRAIIGEYTVINENNCLYSIYSKKKRKKSNMNTIYKTRQKIIYKIFLSEKNNNVEIMINRDKLLISSTIKAKEI